ncbi:hypothetical protein O7627_27475 [Solwaraspora sp. WMMD1047]|uniref:hypothetical protein n=1 Tax=Solwaraspora sp. WMMD1047 TaxID=3016102 RepID=UPI002415B984|nr:hypothetical protein [Solwaraspora sp. WMMD1047]MDG4833018.1 hypothetical protein [Solwaraspora sp. WMMD1047]
MSVLGVEMILSAYDTLSARRLAGAISAGTGGPRGRGQFADARVLDAGSGWYVNDWRDRVRRLADRGAVAVLGVRTLPAERLLPDADWRQILNDLTRRPPLAGHPWVAARTGVLSVALIAGVELDPYAVESLREFVRSLDVGRRSSNDPQPAAERDPADTSNGQGQDQEQSPAEVADLNFGGTPEAGPGPQPPTNTQPARSRLGRRRSI